MAFPKAGLEAHATEILGLSAEGKGCRDIAKVMRDKHGLKVSHETVQRFITKRRMERADVSKAVVREALAPGLTADAERLDEIARDSMKLCRAALKQSLDGDNLLSLEAAALYPKLATAAIKATEAKLKAAGLDQPDDPTSSTLASLFLELERKNASR